MKIILTKHFLLATAFLCLAAFGAKTAEAAVLVVDDNLGCPDAAYSTIQSAVNAAAPGDTIEVCAGTYNENVTVNKAGLTLNGAQAGNPFAGRTFAGPTESTVDGVNVTAGIAAITITAADVTIDGFSVTNPVTSGAAFGITVKTGGNDALITNNIIDTVTSPDAGSVGTAQGVYLENSAANGGADGVGVIANKINDIVSNRSSKGVLIGVNGGGDASQNTLVQGNSITNITSVTRGAYGVSVANTPNVSGLVIRDNNIKDLTGGGWAHAVGLEGPTPGVLVEGNCISNVIDLSPTTPEDAIAVFFENNPSFGTAEVHQNNFENVAYGIAVHPALTAASPAASVDGENNWWGSPSGPTTPDNPGGTGAKVSPGVDFTPWLIARALGGACGGVEATNGSQCKNGGWKTVFRGDGTPFKNQGDCVSYTNNGK
jgi:hypothetical protein